MSQIAIEKYERDESGGWFAFVLEFEAKRDGNKSTVGMVFESSNREFNTFFVPTDLRADAASQPSSELAE